MPRKECYKKSLKCPKCGKEGTVEFEENESPPHNKGKLCREFKSISKGFTTTQNMYGDYEFRCDCNTLIP